MNKIGEINPKNTHKITVYYDGKAKSNPYRVYEEFKAYNKDLYLTDRKRLVAKYADLHSCVALMAQYTMEHNEESR